MVLADLDEINQYKKYLVADMETYGANNCYEPIKRIN